MLALHLPLHQHRDSRVQYFPTTDTANVSGVRRAILRRTAQNNMARLSVMHQIGRRKPIDRDADVGDW